MRTFIGIEIPFEAKRRIYDFEQKILKGQKIKMVELNNLHITLRFLGEVQEKDIEQLKKSLLSAVKQQPFMVSIKNVDGFPDTNQARTIYLSIDKGKEEIVRLYKEIENAIGSQWRKEKKEYIPHITIARVRKGRINIRGKKFSYPPFSIEHFTLFKSELKKTGPEYTIIQRFKLRGNK